MKIPVNVQNYENIFVDHPIVISIFRDVVSKTKNSQLVQKLYEGAFHIFMIHPPVFSRNIFRVIIIKTLLSRYLCKKPENSKFVLFLKKVKPGGILCFFIHYKYRFKIKELIPIQYVR